MSSFTSCCGLPFNISEVFLSPGWWRQPLGSWVLFVLASGGLCMKSFAFRHGRWKAQYITLTYITAPHFIHYVWPVSGRFHRRAFANANPGHYAQTSEPPWSRLPGTRTKVYGSASSIPMIVVIILLLDEEELLSKHHYRNVLEDKMLIWRQRPKQDSLSHVTGEKSTQRACCAVICAQDVEH